MEDSSMTRNAFRVSYVREASGRKAAASSVAGIRLAGAWLLASTWGMNPASSHTGA
jgi:hypothetical protein